MEPTIETIAQTWPLWVAFIALQVLLNFVRDKKNAATAQGMINAAYTKQEARIDALTRDVKLWEARAKEAESITHEMAARLTSIATELDNEKAARAQQAKEIDALKAQVTTLQDTVKAHDKDKQVAEAERDVATKKNAELEAALGTAQARIGELEKRVQHLEALVEAKDKALELVADKIGAAIERVVKPAVDGTAPTAPEPAGS